MEGLIIILIFAVLLLINVPIAIALGVSSMLYVFFFSGGLPVDLIIQSYFAGVDSFSLLAVPFFIMTGDIMLEGGISKRLINFCKVIMGKSTGALGKITVVASAIFAAISGSGPATVACIGGIMIPAMEEDNYDKNFACSISAAAGALGPLIPPSISFIMYGVIAGVSVTDLFLAGIVPGILLALVLVIFTHIAAKKKKWGTPEAIFDNPNQKIVLKHEEEKISAGKAFKDAIWAILVPVIILGGIYGGIFTPTEAAVIAADYAVIVSIYVYKELKWRDLPRVIAKSGLTCGTCLILVSCATAFGRVLTMEQIPMMIAEAITTVSDNWIIVLLLINIFLLIVGLLMETLAAIIILAPILLPVVTSLGVDPIHFGVIMVMNLVIGQGTPPVGVNTFVACRIGGIKMEAMFKWLFTSIGVSIVALMLVTYIEPISMFLVNMTR